MRLADRFGWLNSRNQTAKAGPQFLVQGIHLTKLTADDAVMTAGRNPSKTWTWTDNPGLNSCHLEMDEC